MEKQIAVITPFKNESIKCIQRCIASVAEQTYLPTMHVIICDGAEFPTRSIALPKHVHLIHLPQGCEDTGATPRAIGSIYAITHFCDGLAYLDIDNRWSNGHLQDAVNTCLQGTDVIISDRYICDYDNGEPMYVDDFENTISVVDTNCITLFGKAMIPGSLWWQVPRTKGERTAGVDRYIWQRITAFVKKNNLRIGRTHKPSAYYGSRWAHHYTRINRTPPKPCKTLVNKNGVMVAQWSEQ